MPELPEVETIRRGLQQLLLGEKIVSTTVFRQKSFRGDPQSLCGATIIAVERRGKLLIMKLADGRALICHLKMTGQLLFHSITGKSVMGGHPESEYLRNLPGKHTRVHIRFVSGSELFFNDLRVFGYLHVMTGEELAELPFLQKLGPEPFSEKFSLEYFSERLARKSKTILKTFLLDQTHVAGLGNIYADETCFRAGVDPRRRCGTLKSHEILALYEAAKEVLTVALQHGGSSARDYLNSIGEKGTYLRVAQVYHRTGQVCNRCGHDKLILRVKIGGRSTHFCQNCQK